MPRLGPTFATLSLLLFAVFFGNIVLAKLGSLTGMRMPLLSPVSEFLILLAATVAGVAFLFCAERSRNDAHTEVRRVPSQQHGKGGEI